MVFASLECRFIEYRVFCVGGSGCAGKSRYLSETGDI